jgi:ribosomal-protein-alanine N-acetyltransferase
MTPQITTSRVHLRPFKRDDAADVFAYASDAEMTRHVTWDAHRTIDDSRAFIDMVLGRRADEHTWAITLRQGAGNVVGAIEVGPCNLPAVQLDYCLARDHWNRGLTSEAAKAVIAWAFYAHPHVVSVVACAVAENIASQRVMEKCGMTFEREELHRWAKYPQPVLQRHYRRERNQTV